MDFVTPFIKFLLKSDYINSNKLFLNAVEAGDGSTGIVTAQIDRAQDVHFVDGSVKHKLIFTVNDYKSISFNQLVKTMIEQNENLEDLLEVQNIVDYIERAAKQGNFPDFGADYEVERMECSHLTPSTPTVTNSDNPLAKYSVPVVIYLMDYTEAIL